MCYTILKVVSEGYRIGTALHCVRIFTIF